MRFETIIARRPIRLIDQAVELGLDRTELLAAAGLREEQLADPETRVSAAKVRSLWIYMLEQIPDPALGLKLGADTRLRDFGLVGYVMLHRRTLRDVFECLGRYSRLVSDLARFEVVARADGAILHFGDPQAREVVILRQQIELGLASIVAAAAELTGRRLEPLEVMCPYPPPEDRGPYTRFLGRNLAFGTPRAGLRVAAHALDLPIVGSDPTLGRYLEDHAKEVLQANRPGGEVSDRVRVELWRQLAEGNATLETVAPELGMSTRTLQRRLDEEGTSFGDILDALRHGLASVMLREQAVSIHELTYLLGYSEPSAFYRAFRRWEKTSPVQFREAVS